MHSDAVTKSSSDLLSSADRVLQEVFRVAHHSCEQTATDSDAQQVCCDRNVRQGHLCKEVRRCVSGSGRAAGCHYLCLKATHASV